MPGGVALRWLPPADDAGSVDGYEILRRRPNRGEGTLMTLVSDTGATDTTYSDTTATEPGVRYTYRVKAIRSGVRSFWSNHAMVLLPATTPLLVSNTGQPESATATITQQYAMGFRLGKHGQGYKISSVSIELAEAPTSLTVSLWISSQPGFNFGGVAHRKLFDFTNPASFRVGLNQFTAPVGAFAYENVDYYIVLSDFSSSLSIKETTSDAEDPGGETGAILWNKAKVRALSSTGRWSSSSSRDSVLRLAVEGSRRDRGILASTYAQPGVGTESGTQEIISLGDDCCFELRVGQADRYLIRGVSLLADDTTQNGGFFGLPFELRKGSEKLFSLTYASAQGDLADGARKLTSPGGINEWTAQGATVAGASSYKLHMDIKEIEGDDEGITRGGVTVSRIYGLEHGAHIPQNYDTPTAPGVTFSGTGSIAIGIPQMAVDGEPLYAMVSNLEQADNGYVSLGAADSTVLAQSFTTGPVSYRLQGIGVNIEGSDSNGNPQVPGGPSSVSVAVHTSSGSGIGTKVFDLVSPDEFPLGHSFFEAPPGAFLEPGTTYAVVWSYVGDTWHRLRKTLADGQDSGALSGFSIENRFLLGPAIGSLTSNTAGNSLEIALYGAAVSDPMVSNLGQDDNGHVSLGGAASKVLSQHFTTGDESDGYRLRGIGVNIEGSDDSDGNPQVPDDPSSVSVAVHTSSGDTTGDKLFDLVSPDEFEPGVSVFEAPPGAFLEPGTTYAVVWSHVRGTWHRLQRTLADDEDSGALSGFSIENQFRVGAGLGSLSADSAGNSLEIAVYGEAVGALPVVAGGYQVTKNWLHIPDGVDVGDQFRLVFVTQDTTGAMSADIEDYNALVQEEAAQEYNHRIIRGVAPEFKAVVCTAAVDARTNTEIRDAYGVPVHHLDGGWDNRLTLIAKSYYQFFSPDWINSISGAIVTGNSREFDEIRPVWTGCDAAGFAHPEAPMGTTSKMGLVAVGLGKPADSTGPPVGPLGAVNTSDHVSAERTESRKIFAISPVFTVIAGP